ncbi:MAG: hypothetical protein LBF66_01055 [Holosporales bacterium]|nr:hypothetical protein [Holosporales bacterium]
MSAVVRPHWRLGFVPCISNGTSLHIPSDVLGFIEVQRTVKQQKSTQRVSRVPYILLLLEIRLKSGH